MKVPFWKRREFWGSVVTGASAFAEMAHIGLFPQHTVAYKVGMGIGVTLMIFGVRRGYKDENLIGQKNGIQLPEGLRKK